MNAPREIAGDAAASAPELVARARQLTAFFSAQADAGESGGALTEQTMAALRSHGLMRMWIPREFGGVEAWPLEALEIIEALAYADGSLGWVYMATQLCMGTAAAYLPP